MTVLEFQTKLTDLTGFTFLYREMKGNNKGWGCFSIKQKRTGNQYGLMKIGYSEKESIRSVLGRANCLVDDVSVKIKNVDNVLKTLQLEIW